MSKFLRALFRCGGSKQKLLFIRGVQDHLDDWCSEHLFQIKEDVRIALKQSSASREYEINRRKETESIDPILKSKIEKLYEEYENLNSLLLNLSVGIESIFREIGLIRESVLRYESFLTNPELQKCALELPKLAASLLLEGVALEVMDGDGLSCPTEWIQSVLNAIEDLFKARMNIADRNPKIFVLTILGTQSTGKSTLLNTMFCVQFPVSAGRCTKGAFLQIIPLQIKECGYDAVILIDTEGLRAPEYKDDETHDNEIATFVLGIADLALINIRGELPLNIERFLEISTAALMRMNKANCHPSALFVHQNCDPTARDLNDSSKQKFIKSMDDVVESQAFAFQMQDKFFGFQDVVDISIANDFFYFSQLFEGAPPMAAPSQKYSMACWELKNSILRKMNLTYKKHGGAKTFREFSEKISSVWDGILKETFVFSLVNNAETRAKYTIGNEISMLKYEMENQINEKISFLSNKIEASFKSIAILNDASENKVQSGEKAAYETILARIMVDFEQEANNVREQQRDKFLKFIAEQVTNKEMYKK